MPKGFSEVVQGRKVSHLGSRNVETYFSNLDNF